MSAHGHADAPVAAHAAHHGPPIANRSSRVEATVLGAPLLDRIRQKSRDSEGRATFLIVCPQSDPDRAAHPEADRRLRAALTQLRSEGIEAHGQVAHPDPYTAAMHAVRDERVDSILVSTFPEQRGSSWLRRDLLGRLRNDAKVPVEHVVVDPADVGVAR